MTNDVIDPTSPNEIEREWKKIPPHHARVLLSMMQDHTYFTERLDDDRKELDALQKALAADEKGMKNADECISAYMNGLGDMIPNAVHDAIVDGRFTVKIMSNTYVYKLGTSPARRGDV